MSNHELTCPFCKQDFYRHASCCESEDQAAKCAKRTPQAVVVERLRDQITRSADYIVNERDSDILHTVVVETLESIATEASGLLSPPVCEAQDWMKRVARGLAADLTHTTTLAFGWSDQQAQQEICRKAMAFLARHAPTSKELVKALEAARNELMMLGDPGTPAEKVVEQIDTALSKHRNR